MAGVGSDGTDSAAWLNMYNQVIYAMGGSATVAAGFGTDTDGFARGMPPRWRDSLLSAAAKACMNLCTCQNPADHPGGCGPYLQICKTRCNNQFPPTPSCSGGTCAKVTYSNTFPRSTDGNKVWDINTDGVAHYGMLPDFLADLALLPLVGPQPPGALNGADLVNKNLMHGAGYFFTTWQKAESLRAQVK